MGPGGQTPTLQRYSGEPQPRSIHHPERPHMPTSDIKGWPSLFRTKLAVHY